MKLQQLWSKVGLPLAVLALAFVAWQKFGWQGVAVVATLAVMWALLHFNRMMQVLKRAADRPVGYVGSAVMLNAKLRPGVPLLHVVAMTKALGELRTPENRQPEIFRWTDGTQSHVDCVFEGGKLQRWELVRPVQPPDGGTPSGAQLPATPGVDRPAP